MIDDYVDEDFIDDGKALSPILYFINPRLWRKQ